MTRVYISADARCRQLERLVRQSPGVTVEQLALGASISYFSTAAYVRRLEREGRIEVVLDEPRQSRGCMKWLFPPGGSPAEQKAA